MSVLFFFKQKTAYEMRISDWSSDVCSSDLDGVEALDYLLRRGRFADRPEGDLAVLLLDIKMPRMDGLEVLTQLRGHEHLKRLPVVILSSSREENDLARSWDLGVNAYVVKDRKSVV